MKLFTIVICLILLLCIISMAEADLWSFLSTLPSEIGSAFSSAWIKVTDTIRKPVRIKRLGRVKRRKTTTTPSTTTKKPTTTDLISMRKYFLSSTTKSISVKHPIPVIPKPKWQSFLGRKNVMETPRRIKYVDRSDCEKCRHSYNGVYKRKMAINGHHYSLYDILAFV